MSQAPTAAVDERHRLPVRTLVAASIGNAVEWFDWTIYATFAVYFSSQFFDRSNPTLALIGTTSTYALAFFFRPLGGVLLGRLADLRELRRSRPDREERRHSLHRRSDEDDEPHRSRSQRRDRVHPRGERPAG